MKEIAEEKLEHVRRYTPKLQREIMLYKGQVQRFATFVAADLPTAAAKLDKIVQTLEAYIALQAQEASPQAPVSQPQPMDEAMRDVTEPPLPQSDPGGESAEP